MQNKLAVSISSFISCFLLMQFGDVFTIPFGYVSLLWPVSGVMLGLFLVYGNWLLPSAFAGSLLFFTISNDYDQLPNYVTLVMSALFVLQLVLSKWLVDRFCQLPVKSHSPWHIIQFLLLCGPIASVIPALISTLVLAQHLSYPAQVLVFIGSSIWIANLISIVFITPVILFLSKSEYTRRAQRPFAAISATFVALAVTFSVYLFSSYNHKEDQRARFTDATERYVENIDLMLANIKHNLTALDGFVQSSDHISRAEFKQFSDKMHALHSSNAVRAFGWVPLVSKESRQAFEQELSTELGYDATIFKFTNKGVIVAPEQDSYLAIKYLSSDDRDKKAIGLDVSTHPVVGSTVNAAIDNQTYSITPLFPLLQQQHKVTSAVVYYPSFNRSNDNLELTGLTEIILEIDLLLMSLHQQMANDIYTFELSYGNSHLAHPNANINAKFTHQVELKLFDKSAQLTFYSTPEFEQTLIDWSSFSLLIVGCIIGVICVMFVFFIVTFNASLTRQVKQSTEKLVQQNAELEQANAAKNLFLANISHEYRTPLNAIIGFTEIARSEIKEKAALNYFKQINDSSNILLGIVNDVLDYSKMQAGELRLERRPFNLMTASQSVIDLLSEKAKQKSIKLNANLSSCCDQWVNADEVRFQQILINLVNNAIKFTTYGQVTVECSSEAVNDQQKRFTISVIDTGIGIDKAGLEELFKPFSQAEASISRRFGGTGLGLSIVKQLCHLMKGEVSAESELNRGSKFTITLPFDLITAPSGEQNSNNSVKPNDYSKCKVLVAEDNKVNQLVISKHLENLKLPFVLADNGQQAIEKLQQEVIDLVIMDLQMPVMDGFSASREIKQNEALRHIPIVILSASVGEDEKQQAHALQIFDYIEKPFKREELIKVLNKYLN